MNTQSLQLGKAFQLTMKTLPILLIRLGVSFLFWLVGLIYLIVTGGVAFLVAQAIPIVGVILFLVAIVGIAPLYNLAYRYVLYVFKAAHIAVVSEVIEHGQLPDGMNQLSFGKQRVQERFGEASSMFVVDELVSGVVRTFTRTVYRLTSWLPGSSGALDTLVNIANRVIRFSLSYIDEAILARSFWTRSDNVWANARDGVVLYSMAWKPILMNAIFLMLISYIPFIAALLLFSAPVGFLVATISPQLAGWSIIAVLLLAWLIKVAVGDAFAMTAIIVTYQRETAGLEPNPEMVSRLDGISDKFTEIRQRAQEEFGRKPKREPTDTDIPPSTSPIN